MFVAGICAGAAMLWVRGGVLFLGAGRRVRLGFV